VVYRHDSKQGVLEFSRRWKFLRRSTSEQAAAIDDRTSDDMIPDSDHIEINDGINIGKDWRTATTTIPVNTTMIEGKPEVQ
jgi:hypothetical protein